LTDELIRGFYGCEPPRFLILSATCLLPLPLPAVTASDCRNLARLRRDVHYNPQRHLPPGELAELRGEKSNWIRREPADTAGRRERFAKLRELSEIFVPRSASGKRS